MQTVHSEATRGFTLIELLVTIAIVAIISVISVTAYATVQATARDGARKALITQVGKAIEGSKDGLTGTYKYTDTDYNADFGRTASGVLYTDPPAFNPKYVYCVKTSTSTGLTYTPVVDANWTLGACPAGANDGLFATLATSTCATGRICFGDVKSWVLCARLERTTTPYCVNSGQ